MSEVKAGALLVYALIALVVCAAFTGSMYRGEMPLGLLAGLQREAAKSGAGNADLVLTAAFYLVYYSSLFTLPFMLFRTLLYNAPSHLDRLATELSALTAAWCGLTFLLYHNAVFSLIRTVFRSGDSQLIGLLWLLGFVCVLVVWYHYLRKASGGTGDGA